MLLDVILMEGLPVIYQGKDYILICQYASGYCEIVEEGKAHHKIKLVHFSELKLRGAYSWNPM
jgi:hypothetical protein